MSVDTSLKGKNTKGYHSMEFAGVKVLVAPGLVRNAKRLSLDVNRFLFWKSFDIEVEPLSDHLHGPT